MKRAFTRWFPAAVRPVRPGVYQRNHGKRKFGDPSYSRWDGEQWFFTEGSAHDAARATQPSYCQAFGFTWRGLATEPGK